jgi:glycosyltransferase involved in cell wall biosynthesis
MIESFLFVSIILPVRNEAASIERGLRAILEQDYPADRMEILIADGMSSDATRERIETLVASLSHPQSSVTILDNPGKIVPTGMNIALRRARGEIIIRVDGHTIIAPDYVRQCVEILQRTQADNVGGKMNAIGSNPFGKAVALATSTPFGVGGARFHYSDAEEWVDTVYMGAWPRRVFEKIGLFDEELVCDQDDEFNYRLRKQAGRILLSPLIRSEYTVRNTLHALWRQYYQYGYWKVRVLQKHPRQMRLRQFAPPAFVLSLLLSFFLLFIPFPSFILHPSSFILLLYIPANLFASLWTILRHRSSVLGRLFFLLPLVFAILHISYGLGFLIGLLKFARRWRDQQGQTPTLVRQDA